MADYATTAPTTETATGAPEGVTLTRMSASDAQALEHKLYTQDELQGVTMTRMDAPPNSVFDQDNNRTLALPQTLSPTETGYLIKRDADQVKEFFGMQEVGGFEALGKGIGSFLAAQPQAFGTLAKEQGELVKNRNAGQKDMYDQMPYAFGAYGSFIQFSRAVRDMTVNLFGADEVIAKSQGLIDRNKKYMADAGWERPEQGGAAGIIYDFGQGGSSLLASVGLAALSRSPATAGLYFGALQKASVYQEARAAGKTPEQASDISTLAGTVEGALEFVGLDHFMKAIKGNSAVTRFVNGFAIEAIQEGSQQGGEEAITQLSGVRDKAASDTVKDILYQSALGGFLGGGSNAALGIGAKENAKKAGLDEKTADAVGKYVTENVDGAKTNMTEFIDKELAPIARDEPTAMEFMNIMKQFGNDQELVNRDSLTPEMRAVFDQYVEMFERSTTDRTSVEDVEKKFYEGAVKNGVDQEQAVAAAKIVGARADAASRALGVSPMEWLESKKLEVKAVSSEKNDADLAEAQMIKESFGQAKSIRNFNREDNAQVQRKLKMKEKPQSLMQFIKSKGGISLGLSQQELANVKAARKSKGVSASKSSMASGELQQIFDGKKNLGHYVSEKGMALDDLYQVLVDGGYLEGRSDEYAHQAEDHTQEVLDLISKEVNGKKVYPVKVERALEEERDGRAENFDQLNSMGIDESMSVEEIAAQLKAYRQDIADYEATLPKEQREFIDEEILFQDPDSYDEEGHAIPTSREFKAWFKKSKVVDDDGKPMVMYHGSGTAIEEFSFEYTGQGNDQLGSGFYFTSHKFEAEGYTTRTLNGQELEDKLGGHENPTVIEAYLSIQKPINADAKSSLSAAHARKIIEQAPNLEDTLAEQYDVEFEGGLDKLLDKLEKMYASNGSYKGALLDRLFKIANDFYAGEVEAFNTAVNEVTGYDGVMKDFDTKVHYAAFFPTQIKSVYNRGTFSENNANILKQGKEKNPQGQVNFGKNKTLIQLFESANPSTLLHELGHVFLRDMRDVAKVTKRPRTKADYEAVKKWLGAKGDTLTVAQEEKFARGFEAYLREGKAPKPELQSVFDTFKKWLESIYKSINQLNVKLTPEIREVFDRMLGGDFAMAESLNQEAAARNIEADYEKVANTEPASTLPDDTKAIFKSTSDLSADAFVPVSTRLGNIDAGLKHAVRRFLFNTGLYTHEDHVKIKPFIEKVSNTFSEQDYRVFDLALKNRDTVKVDFLVDKYGIQKEWLVIRDVLDNLYNEARDVGLDINYIEEYFPRKVKKGMASEYMAAMKGSDQWSEIETALKEADPNGTFTPEDQAAFVNSYLRGFSSSRINLARPSYTKERTVDYVTPDFNRFYNDSMPTLMDYIGALRHGIESRKLFGKSEKETDENIGAYVLSLVNAGIIKSDQELELKKILKAVVEPTGTHGAVAWAKNASYVYLMGSPISAITQIQDLAFSLHHNGYFRTPISLLKSLTGNQLLKKEDLGIDNILREFEDESRANRFVRATFKAVGLEWMDNVGKETYIDAAYGRIVAAAKKDKNFDEVMKPIFGEETAQLKKDLLDGTMSENVKYLLFSELSDVQPISLAEMPVGYLRGGNGRVFYMLKTYTIKQLDIYRREIFANIFSTDPRKVGLGLKNLISLGASLMMLGMGSDALKDLLLGRDIDIDDLITDNLLKLMGFTKYQIYKAKDEGIGNATLRTLFMPPVFAVIDDIGKDVGDIVMGKESKRTGKVTHKDWKDAEVLGKVPVVGKFYYWWWGGGKAKTEKKSKVSTP